MEKKDLYVVLQDFSYDNNLHLRPGCFDFPKKDESGNYFIGKNINYGLSRKRVFFNSFNQDSLLIFQFSPEDLKTIRLQTHLFDRDFAGLFENVQQPFLIYGRTPELEDLVPDLQKSLARAFKTEAGEQVSSYRSGIRSRNYAFF